MKALIKTGVVCLSATVCLTGCWFGSDSEKDSKKQKPAVQRQSKAAPKQAKKDLVQEYQTAEALVASIKDRKNQTELQRKESFEKLKGKMVVFKGEVRNVGTTVFGGKTYVSLKVGSLNMFENINIQFNVPESLKKTVSAWGKGETHILRGRIVGTGDVEDDAVCDNVELVDEAEFAKVKDSAVKTQVVPAPTASTSKQASGIGASLGALKNVASSLGKDKAEDLNVSKDDVKAAIRVWQKSRWKADEIVAARKKNGKVKIEDLAVSCNLPEMQPVADLLIADYIIAVNVLDAFESTPNEAEAAKALVTAVSLEDVAKMMSDAAKVMLSLKDMKEKAQNNKWKFMKDSYLITTMSSSMSGGFKIVKSILEKELGK